MARKTLFIFVAAFVFCQGVPAKPQGGSVGCEGDALDPAINPVCAPYLEAEGSSPGLAEIEVHAIPAEDHKKGHYR